MNPTHSIWIWIAKPHLFCCSENREPVVKILGRSFASDLEIEAHADAVSVVDRMKEESLSKDSEVKVKLFQLLQDMDKQILDKLLKDMSEWVLFFFIPSVLHNISI